MGRLKIQITDENAAFTDNWGWEMSRILTKLGQRLLHTPPGDVGFPLMDANGNKVGAVDYFEDVNYPPSDVDELYGR